MTRCLFHPVGQLWRFHSIETPIEQMVSPLVTNSARLVWLRRDFVEVARCPVSTISPSATRTRARVSATFPLGRLLCAAFEALGPSCKVVTATAGAFPIPWPGFLSAALATLVALLSFLSSHHSTILFELTTRLFLPALFEPIWGPTF